MSSHTPTLRERTAGEVRAEMARQRKTGVELASLLDCSQQAASRRFNGEVDISLDELDAIADWLGVPLARLIQQDRAAAAAVSA